MVDKNKKRNVRRRKQSSRRKPHKTKKAKRALVRRPTRYDSRLEAGLKYMRSGDTAAGAARKIGATPSQLRRYVVATGIAERREGKWQFKRDRRFRRMPMYSDGKRVVITVHNSKSASHIGAYMRAVRLFFETEDTTLLDPFYGKSVPDVNGKRYAFEIRPNVLFRLDASGVEPFELVYQIVKPE
jgi:hypothetical protein